MEEDQETENQSSMNNSEISDSLDGAYKSQSSEVESEISVDVDPKHLQNLEETFDGKIENFLEKDENEKSNLGDKKEKNTKDLFKNDSENQDKNEIDTDNVIDFEDLEIQEKNDKEISIEDREKQEMKLVNQKKAAEEGI